MVRCCASLLEFTVSGGFLSIALLSWPRISLFSLVPFIIETSSKAFVLLVIFALPIVPLWLNTILRIIQTRNESNFSSQHIEQAALYLSIRFFFFALSFSLNVCTVHVFLSVISYFAHILLLFFLPFISFRLFAIARSSIIFGSLWLAFWHCRSFWLQLQLFLLFIRTLFHPICNTFKLDVIVFNDNNIAIATPHQSV